MPTYVYECKSCLDVFEVEQRITEDALTDCPCGAKGTVKRVIQPVGIAFKGSGFYVNDSKGAAPVPEKPAAVATPAEPAAAEAAAPVPAATAAPADTPAATS